MTEPVVLFQEIPTANGQRFGVTTLNAPASLNALSVDMVRLAAAKLDAGHAAASTYCAMAKRFATDAGFNVCNDALQLPGGYGYLGEFPLERLVRDARVHQILEGTNEIMRVIVSRKLLEGDGDIR